MAIVCNNAKEKVVIGSIRVNGTLVKNWQSATDPVLWHRVTNRVLSPGSKGLIVCKLAAFQKGPIQLEVTLGDRIINSYVKSDSIDPVRISAVRFNASGKRMNIFLTNYGDKPERIIAVDVQNGEASERIETRVYLKPGVTDAARIHLSNALNAGDAIKVFVHLKDRMIATRCRAFPGFRITVESPDADIASRIHADPNVRLMYQFQLLMQ